VHLQTGVAYHDPGVRGPEKMVHIEPGVWGPGKLTKTLIFGLSRPRNTIPGCIFNFFKVLYVFNSFNVFLHGFNGFNLFKWLFGPIRLEIHKWSILDPNRGIFGNWPIGYWGGGPLSESARCRQELRLKKKK